MTEREAQAYKKLQDENIELHLNSGTRNFTTIIQKKMEVKQEGKRGNLS